MKNIPGIESSALVVVDLQTKLTGVMDRYPAVQERAVLFGSSADLPLGCGNEVIHEQQKRP